MFQTETFLISQVILSSYPMDSCLFIVASTNVYVGYAQVKVQEYDLGMS